MKTLLIDAGNSHLKWVMLEAGLLSIQQSFSYEKKTPVQQLNRVIDSIQKECDSILMVSVLGDAFAAEAQETADDKGIKLEIVKSQSELAGIKNAYNEPHKLGTDRLVAMVAAYKLANLDSDVPQACIVIDSGTATTVDAVNELGQHLGGIIMPGLSLCSESLLDNTQLLSLCNRDNQDFIPDCFSKDTSTAIASGCLLGLAGGIDSICDKMEKALNKTQNKNSMLETASVKRIICGGAAKKLYPHLQSNVLIQENLLMLGLQAIKEDS
jgi:type III pantothenate kinase